MGRLKVWWHLLTVGGDERCLDTFDQLINCLYLILFGSRHSGEPVGSQSIDGANPSHEPIQTVSTTGAPQLLALHWSPSNASARDEALGIWIESLLSQCTFCCWRNYLRVVDCSSCAVGDWLLRVDVSIETSTEYGVFCSLVPLDSLRAA